MGPAGIPNQELYYLGTPKNAATDYSGVVDHIAFLASEPAEFVDRFKKLGMSYRPRSLPESELFQLFIKDPERPHHRAQFLRHQGRAGLGRRGLLQDADGAETVE